MNDQLTKYEFNKSQLWEGCILASIAHAITVAQYPYVSKFLMEELVYCQMGEK